MVKNKISLHSYILRSITGGFLFLPREDRSAELAIGADMVVVHIQQPQALNDIENHGSGIAAGIVYGGITVGGKRKDGE